MPWPFDLRFMQLALAAGLVVGACAPLIGTFLVQRRLSLMGDGLGHLAFAGVAAGLLAGVWPVWTALVVAVVGAIALERLRRVASGDLALALFFYGGIAAGVVLISASRSLDANILTYLFGAILTVNPGEVWTIGALGAIIVAAVAIAGRALFAVALDEESARVAGLPVDALNSALAALTAVTVVVAMRVVGLLLVAALMVLPVGAAQALARSFRATMTGAAGVGVASVIIGLTLARVFDLAPGGTIVLVSAVAFGAASILGRRRSGGVQMPVAPGLEPQPGGDAHQHH
jgi:zinc transport system permease protein